MIANNPTDPFRPRQPRVEPTEMAVLDTAQQAELIEAVREGSSMFHVDRAQHGAAKL
jgi:hypothetical protein